METYTPPKTTLLGIADLRDEFGLGRDLATRLARLLPHIRIGRTGRGERIAVKRADLERFLDRATAERADLWEIAKQHTPESLAAWMNPESIGGVN